jgi:hypothetical protein
MFVTKTGEAYPAQASWYLRGEGLVTASDAEVEMMLGRLEASTSYDMKYRAINTGDCVDPGAWSDVLTESTTDPTLPQAPLGSQISMRNITGGAATVYVGYPFDDGGVPLSYVAVYLRKVGDLEYDLGVNLTAVVLPAYTTHRFFGLSANTEYDLYVVVQSDVGSSQASDSISFTTTPVTPPDEPRALTADTITGGRIEFTWASPQDLGGVDTVDYQWFFCTNPSDEETCSIHTSCAPCRVLAGEGLEGYVSLLLASTAYFFRVQATNEAGSGPLSLALSAVTGASSDPTPPGDMLVGNRTTTSIQIGLVRSSDEGGDVGQYSIDIYDQDDEDWTAGENAWVGAYQPWVLFESLGQGERYLFRSRFTNPSTTTSDNSVVATAATRGEQCVEGTGMETGIFFCRGFAGDIEVAGYEGMFTRTWRIEPDPEAGFFVGIELHFRYFDFECDRDRIMVKQYIGGDEPDITDLWDGGCSREPFTVWSDRGQVFVEVTVFSDMSVHGDGFLLQYIRRDAYNPFSFTPPPISCPNLRGHGGVCADQGVCDEATGACQCDEGWAGEDCSALELCGPNVDENHFTCHQRERVIAVAPHGSDTVGTGEMALYDPNSERYKVGKPYKTLRHALSQAVTNDTIILLYPGTYSGDDYCGFTFDGWEGSLGQLHIEGPRGSDVTIIDCTDATNRPFTFLDDSSIFQGITIKGGHAADGAAIQVEGGAPYLQDIHFTTNVAATSLDSIARGGALKVFGAANLTLDACEFDHNEADLGGALHISGIDTTVLMLNNPVHDNTATALGGAMHVTEHANVTAMEGTFLRDNTAGEHGGALWLANAEVNSDDWTLRLIGNTADLSGGGIATGGDVAILRQARLTRNEAPYGGGHATLEGKARLTDCAFDFNTASLAGGAIAALGGQTFALRVTTGNDTALFGGAVYIDDAQVFGDELTIRFATAQAGGGVAVNGTYLLRGIEHYIWVGVDIDLEVEGGIAIHHCEAKAGGGVYAWPGSRGVIDRVLVGQCAATGFEVGPMYAGCVNLCLMQQITDGRVVGGAGLFASHVASLLVGNTTFVSNRAVYSRGAGAHIVAPLATEDGTPAVVFENTDFSDGYAWGGGGLAVRDAEINLKDVVIEGNEAKMGGGIHVENSILRSVGGDE